MVLALDQIPVRQRSDPGPSRKLNPFSPAFLGRVGDPILFEELTHGTLATIFERAVVSAIQTAAERYSVPIGEIVLEDGLGLDVVKSSHLANAMLGHVRLFISADHWPDRHFDTSCVPA